MKRIIVLIDSPGWAFEKLALGLKKYARGCHIDIHSAFESIQPDFGKYDTVVYLCDHRPERLLELGIPPEKVVFCLRSMVSHPFYDDKHCFGRCCKVVLASNRYLCERFKDVDVPVLHAPGGVDTEIYKFKTLVPHEPLRMGWAGSRDSFGEECRGLDVIKEYCKRYNDVAFTPAYREDRWRTEAEMVDYYYSIDIYVDMSRSAGRQGGLLEAAACGRPIITGDAGIAPEFIREGYNGYLIKRTPEALHEAIYKIRGNLTDMGRNARESIEYAWSWEKQVQLIERGFE